MKTNSLIVKSAGFYKKELGIAIIFARSVKNIFFLHHLGWTEIKCLAVQVSKNIKNSLKFLLIIKDAKY
jgi:hypothetical protein